MQYVVHNDSSNVIDKRAMRRQWQMRLYKHWRYSIDFQFYMLYMKDVLNIKKKYK